MMVLKPSAPKSGLLCVCFFLGKCAVLCLKFYVQCFQRTALLLMTTDRQIINLNYLYVNSFVPFQMNFVYILNLTYLTVSDDAKHLPFLCLIFLQENRAVHLKYVYFNVNL